MSTRDITEFLTELNDTDSLAALHEAHSQKSILVFKVDAYPNPIKTFIDNFLDKRAILPSDLTDFKLPTDKEVSFKFNVGTEVFFIKTFIKSHLNRYYFDMTSKVIHLKRRGAPRHIIPKKWSQTAGIVINAAKLTLLKCTMIDISLSGARFEIEPKQNVPDFQCEDIVRIKFQIYKRAEIDCLAIIRFISKKPNAPVIVGLEYVEISDVQTKRIASIIEDINMFVKVTKN